MCELYISTRSIFEYWQYTKDSTPDKLPTWLTTDEKLEILQHDDRLFLLDCDDREFVEMWYDDYIFKPISDEYIYISETYPIVNFNDIDNYYIKYNNYFIKESDIIEAYKYNGIYDPDNMPSWVSKDSFKTSFGDSMGILDIERNAYRLVEPDYYVYRYPNINNWGKRHTTESFSRKNYIRLNKKMLGYKNLSNEE